MLVRTLAREADMFHNTAPDGIQGPSPTHQQQHQPQQQPGQPCADNAVEGSLGSSVQGSCVQDPSVQGTCDASGSPGSGSSTAEARAGPYIRTISYSPGPLDTDMQVCVGVCVLGWCACWAWCACRVCRVCLGVCVWQGWAALGVPRSAPVRCSWL